MAVPVGIGKDGLIVGEPAIELRQHEVQRGLMLSADEARVDQGLYLADPVPRLVAIIKKLRLLVRHIVGAETAHDEPLAGGDDLIEVAIGVLQGILYRQYLLDDGAVDPQLFGEAGVGDGDHAGHDDQHDYHGQTGLGREGQMMEECHDGESRKGRGVTFHYRAKGMGRLHTGVTQSDGSQKNLSYYRYIIECSRCR